MINEAVKSLRGLTILVFSINAFVFAIFLEQVAFKNNFQQFEIQFAELALVNATQKVINMDDLDDNVEAMDRNGAFAGYQALTVLGQYYFAHPNHFLSWGCDNSLLRLKLKPGVVIELKLAPEECAISEGRKKCSDDEFFCDENYPTLPLASPDNYDLMLCFEQGQPNWVRVSEEDIDNALLALNQSQHSGERGVSGRVAYRIKKKSNFAMRLQYLVQGGVTERNTIDVYNYIIEPFGDGEYSCIVQDAYISNSSIEVVKDNLFTAYLSVQKYVDNSELRPTSEYDDFLEAYQSLHASYFEGETNVPVVQIKTRKADTYFLITLLNMALLVWALTLLRTIRISSAEDLNQPWAPDLLHKYRKSKFKWYEKTGALMEYAVITFWYSFTLFFAPWFALFLYLSTDIDGELQNWLKVPITVVFLYVFTMGIYIFYLVQKEALRGRN